MTTVFDANTLPLIIALLVGLVVGWWMFKRIRNRPERRPADAGKERHALPVRQERAMPPGVDGLEGNSIVDQGAAAAADVAGEVLGVQAHSQLPGAGPADNLETMKGVGPKFAARLHENGITRFEQLARLSANEVAILDDRMGPFKGRIVRDRVVEQASYLARGDNDGFEGKFGKLGSEA